MKRVSKKLIIGYILIFLGSFFIFGGYFFGNANFSIPPLVQLNKTAIYFLTLIILGLSFFGLEKQQSDESSVKKQKLPLVLITHNSLSAILGGLIQ